MSSTMVADKEVREVLDRLKDGYTVKKRGGHFAILDPDGEVVRKEDGKPLTIAGTPHGGRQTKNLIAELRRAKVLKPVRGQRRRTAPTEERQTERRVNAEQLEVRRANRQREATELRDRLEAVLGPVGGLDPTKRSTQADVARVGSMLAREMGQPELTPDLTQPSINRVAQGAWVEPRYQAVWNRLAEVLEEENGNPIFFFKLVRKARGLPDPEDVVTSRRNGKPTASDEWPFTVELLHISDLFVDHEYQRPPAWPFIRKLASVYDERLVGTIDVSQRGSRFAVLDGQLRYEAAQLVGKSAVWCSVYQGLDLAGEAAFFLHKNRDRRAIHPFYTFKARIVAGDGEAGEIESIVSRYGYELAVSDHRGQDKDAITAIASIEAAHERSSETRAECLSPTLDLLRRSTYGMAHGQNGSLIRGVARFMERFDEERFDRERLVDVLAEKRPSFIIGRAREKASGNHSSTEHAVERVLVEEYNEAAPKAQRLPRIPVGG